MWTYLPGRRCEDEGCDGHLLDTIVHFGTRMLRNAGEHAGVTVPVCVCVQARICRTRSTMRLRCTARRVVSAAAP